MSIYGSLDSFGQISNNVSNICSKSFQSNVRYGLKGLNALHPELATEPNLNPATEPGRGPNSEPDLKSERGSHQLSLLRLATAALPLTFAFRFLITDERELHSNLEQLRKRSFNHVSHGIHQREW